MFGYNALWIKNSSNLTFHDFWSAVIRGEIIPKAMTYWDQSDMHELAHYITATDEGIFLPDWGLPLIDPYDESGNVEEFRVFGVQGLLETLNFIEGKPFWSLPSGFKIREGACEFACNLAWNPGSKFSREEMESIIQKEIDRWDPESLKAEILRKDALWETFLSETQTHTG